MLRWGIGGGSSTCRRSQRAAPYTSESVENMMREGFFSLWVRICETSACHCAVYHRSYLRLEEEFTVNAACQGLRQVVISHNRTLHRREAWNMRPSNHRNRLHLPQRFIVWVTLEPTLRSLVRPLVYVRLPKAIHVSRRARGEITPTLSLLSGPHLSAIVQAILWKHHGHVGRLKVWLMRLKRKFLLRSETGSHVCHHRWCYHAAFMTYQHLQDYRRFTPSAKRTEFDFL